jgi:hypothetical protein
MHDVLPKCTTRMLALVIQRRHLVGRVWHHCYSRNGLLLSKAWLTGKHELTWRSCARG